MEQQFLFDEPAMAQQVQVKIRTKGKHWVLMALLKGCFIAKRSGKSKRYEHCVYQGKSDPVKLVTKVEWREVKLLLKEKRKDVYIISLKEVRALHGNCLQKKLYKKFKAEQKNNL